MSYSGKLRVFAAGCVSLGLLALGGPAQAATMAPHTYVLHGSGQFKTAMASAVVTQVSKGDFSVSIVAEHLPSPAMLHVKPARKVYVAWFINGMAKQGSMAATARLALMYDKKTGNYTAKGAVMIDEVTSVIVTAEPSTMDHAPAMPEVTALTSSMAHPAM
jgi:hypothetical protein